MPTLRTTGPTLSAFNAWVAFKGLETLNLRMNAQSENALQLATWLEQQPEIEHVYYPGLTSHPQFELAKKQQTAGGAIVSFVLKAQHPTEAREKAWALINATKLLSITANLGDTRTTITHPSTTTHGRLSPEIKLEAGITEGLIRLAVGLEDVQDLMDDLRHGLNSEHALK